MFDYLVSLQFARISGVECVAKKNMERGEVDVLADFTGATKRIHRLTGNLVPIENKWESNATKQREIHIHHRKAELAELQSSCLVSCFVSMGGFTSDAKRELQNCQNPNMIGFDRDDFEEFLNSNNPREHFRNKII